MANTPCPGLRPGGLVGTPNGLCTMNFVFSGSDGNRYAGTAGHCASAADGEQVWAPGEGPAATDAQGNRIGEFVYSFFTGLGLFRLDPGVEVSPQMCHWGGPTGLNADLVPPPTPVVLRHYGQGRGIRDVAPARTMVALGMPSPKDVFPVGVAFFGDSGSPVISDDGRAVGWADAVGVFLDYTNGTGGNLAISRLVWWFGRVEELLGLSLTVQTADLLRP